MAFSNLEMKLEPKMPPSTSNLSIESEVKTMIEPSLSRLTKGLPKHELILIMMEAQECEEALLKEIRLLEAAAGLSQDGAGTTTGTIGKTNDKQSRKEDRQTYDRKEKKQKKNDKIDKNKSNSDKVESKTSSASSKLDFDPDTSLALGGWALDSMQGLNHHSTVESMMKSIMTPTDRYFSLSALLGRLRQPLNLSPTPQASSFLKKNNNSLTIQVTSSATNTSINSNSSLSNHSSSGSNSINNNKDKQKHRNSSNSNTSTSSSDNNSRRKSSSKKSDTNSSNNNHSSNHSQPNNESNITTNNTHQTALDNKLDKQQQQQRKQNIKLLEKQKALLAMSNNPIYYKKLEQPQLLLLWKRLSSHRTATVFRKPVSSRDGKMENTLLCVCLLFYAKILHLNTIPLLFHLFSSTGI